jgi:hypothetical protein
MGGGSARFGSSLRNETCELQKRTHRGSHFAQQRSCGKCPYSAAGVGAASIQCDVIVWLGRCGTMFS